MLKYNYKTKRIEGKVKSFDRERHIVIDFSFDKFHDHSLESMVEHLKSQQVAVYVMCGGGMLGRFGMCQPADFYIDSRVGRLPYPNKDIYQAIEVLKAIADFLKLDAHKLPEPKMLGSWIF